jgi:hypothetical protein
MICREEQKNRHFNHSPTRQVVKLFCLVELSLAIYEANPLDASALTRPL